MLTLSDISFAIEGRPLFDHASARIPAGHKVGLVGRNGSGKTTLFRMIRGELALEGGEISLPSRARIGGVAQEVPSSATSLIDTVLAADTERAALMAEAEHATDPHRIADIQHRLADIDAWSAEARASAILRGLGFTAEEQQRPCSDFSGGWRMRVALAGVLFAQPDLLLLDEPTNYLDLEGALWLENYLQKYPHTVIIISHDRELLNRSVGAILHLENRKLTFYQGPYDQFARARAEKRALLAAEAKKQDARREHLQSLRQPLQGQGQQGQAGPEPGEDAGEDDADHRARRGRETRLLVPDARGTVAADHQSRRCRRGLWRRAGAAAPQPADRPGRPDRASGPQRRGQIDAVEAAGRQAGALRGRDHPVVQAADRLFRPASGRRAAYRRDAAAARHAPAPGRGPAAAARAAGRASALAPIRRKPRSGGFRAGRRRGCRCCWRRIDAPHLLILDEPTNHLDIESREALVEALTGYAGAVVLVSHDMHLLSLVADRLWLVSNGAVTPYEEDLQAYRRMLLSGDDTPRAEKPKPEKRRASRDEVLALRAEVRKCEERIAKIEEMRDRLAKKLADPALYEPGRGGEVETWQKKYAEVMDGLDRAEALWLTAQERLEGASG